MFRITPEFATEAARGNLLSRPPEAVVKGEGASWKEIAKIEDFEVTEVEPGKEQVVVKFRIPSDVVSSNQGRAFSDFFRFPWAAAQSGEKKAQTSCSINYRNIVALLKAAGHDEALEFLSQIPKTIIGMRVQINVKEETTDDYGPQNRFGGYKAPKA
jgi:hypothetical protein